MTLYRLNMHNIISKQIYRVSRTQKCIYFCDELH